jgi:hypothetical protein
MAFVQQTSLHQDGLDDDPNQSFDASSYINDDGDSPEPFDNLGADPLSSETDSGVHDIMHDMDNENGMNHFLKHASSGNPGDITFVSDNLAGGETSFDDGLATMAPDMHLNRGQALEGSYRITGLSAEESSNQLHTLDNKTLEDPPNENIGTMSGSDMTPRAVKTGIKAGSRSLDHQRYAAAMQQHHHAGNTLYSAAIQPGRREDGVEASISPPQPAAGEDTLAPALASTTPLQRLMQTSSDASGATSALYANINVKREPTENGTSHFYTEPSDPAPSTATGVPLQIRPFEQFEADETGQDDDDDEGKHNLLCCPCILLLRY